MSRFVAFWNRAREQRGRARIDAEFREELQHHVERLREEYIQRGMTADEAHRAAMLHIGGFEQARELVNERRGFLMLDHLARDVRHALRVIRKSPGFATVAILTLALGIGVNAAIFSFIDAVILRPLPYPHSDRLVAIWEMEKGGDRGAAAPANVGDYKRVSSLEDVAGYSNVSVSLTGDGQPEGHIGEAVTANYFAVLRVPPALGRAFTSEEDSPAGRKVVVISDSLWQNRFGADPAILGRAIAVDGVPHEIVGVMPAGFRGLTQFGSAVERHLWLPAAYPAELLANRGDHEISLVARLRDGAEAHAANAELAAISEALAVSYPATNAKVRAQLQPLGDDVVRRVRVSLVALMMTVGLILTIACVNVANLLIARGVGRRREISVRYALGATRMRVYTALVTESVVLALLASAAGLFLAYWIQGLLVSVAPASMPRLADVSIGARVVGFTLGLSLLIGILFGGLPAWQAGQARPVDAMSSGGRIVAGRKVMRWRNALMIGQVALSALLLVGAGLMIRSLVKLNAVDLGFDTRDVIAMRTTLPLATYPTGDARLAFFEQLETRLASLPGVTSVGFANSFPMRGGWSSGFAIEGRPLPAAGYFEADFQAVSPGYFTTLGIPLLRGRPLSPSDRKGAMPVAIVSEAFERQLLGGADAIGTRVSRGPTSPSITIVGVVRDVRRDGKTALIAPQVYLPAAQTGIYPVRLSELAVRAAHGAPHDLVPAIRSAIWAVDPNQPITNIRTLEETLVLNAAERRFQTLLFTIFGVLALLLASIGTYGVVAYLVSQRTPEIGVRLALGAGRGRIYRWLVGRTAILLMSGTIAGMIAARWLSTFVEGMLFQITPNDPITYAAAGAALLGVALAACIMAVRRAARIDPTVALRYE